MKEIRIERQGKEIDRRLKELLDSFSPSLAIVCWEGHGDVYRRLCDRAGIPVRFADYLEDCTIEGYSLEIHEHSGDLISIRLDPAREEIQQALDDYRKQLYDCIAEEDEDNVLVRWEDVLSYIECYPEWLVEDVLGGDPAWENHCDSLLADVSEFKDC